MGEGRKPLIYVPSQEQKDHAGAQAKEILNSLSQCSDDLAHQAYILQIVMECFEEEYDIDIRHGYSISDDDSHKPNPRK